MGFALDKETGTLHDNTRVTEACNIGSGGLSSPYESGLAAFEEQNGDLANNKTPKVQHFCASCLLGLSWSDIVLS